LKQTKKVLSVVMVFAIIITFTTPLALMSDSTISYDKIIEYGVVPDAKMTISETVFAATTNGFARNFVSIQPLSNLTPFVTVTHWDVTRASGTSMFDMRPVPTRQIGSFNFSWQLSMPDGTTVQAGDIFSFALPQPVESGTFHFGILNWTNFNNEHGTHIGDWRVSDGFIEVRFNENIAYSVVINGTFDLGMTLGISVPRQGVQYVMFAGQYMPVNFQGEPLLPLNSWESKGAVFLRANDRMQWAIGVHNIGMRQITGEFGHQPGTSFTRVSSLFVSDTLSGRFGSVSFESEIKVPMSINPDSPEFGHASQSIALSIPIPFTYLIRIAPIAEESFEEFSTRLSQWQWGVWTDGTTDTFVVNFGAFGQIGPRYSELLPNFAEAAANATISDGFFEESDRQDLINYFNSTFGDDNVIDGRLANVRITLNEIFYPVSVITRVVNRATVVRNDRAQEVNAFGYLEPVGGGGYATPASRSRLSLSDQITNAPLADVDFQLQQLSDGTWYNVLGRVYRTDTEGTFLTGLIANGIFRFAQLNFLSGYHLPSSAGFDTEAETVVSSQFELTAGGQGEDVSVQNIRRFLVTFDLQNGSQNLTNYVVHNARPAHIPLPGTDFYRPHYTFRGWGTSADATTFVNPASEIISDARTFFAIWERANNNEQRPTDPLPPVIGGGGSGGGVTGGPSGGVTGQVQQPPTPPIEQDEETTVFSPYHNAFMVGFADGTIRPHANVSRAEVATMLFRLLGDEFRSEMWSQQNTFSDVNTNHWFNNAVSTLANIGIIIDQPNNIFRPNDAITRAEFASFVARFFADDLTTQSSFPDIEGNWAEDYINMIAQFGLVQGDSAGMFNPNALMTRAEGAAIIGRMLDRVLYSTEGLLSGRTIWPDTSSISSWYYLYLQEATHSTEFERTESGNVVWTRILPHLDWTVLETTESRPWHLQTSRITN